MRIGFLTTANSWHVPVKTKNFVLNGHDVFYFQIFPGTNQPIVPKNVKCINIDSSFRGIFNLLHKMFLTYHYSKSLNLDILHIIDMKYSYYAYCTKAKKIVFENNGSDVLVLPLKHKWLRFLYKLFYKKADAVVQDSEVTQKAGLKYNAPIEYNRVIELGIDFNIFNKYILPGVARKKMGLTDQKIVFSPRGFSELYNIETIIKSIPIVKKFFNDVKYVFCRHFGKNENEYFNLIDSLDVASNVIFTGFLDNELDLPYYYKDADIVVSVPSSDSSPRSVYESMACLTPVIISELPWYHKKFIKDKDVFVVPIKDESKLAETIIEFFNKDRIIDVLSAYKYVELNINMVSSAQILEQLYKEILGNN